MSDKNEKALKLELNGKYEEAASLYYQIGKAEKAAYLYQKAGLTEQSLKIYQQEKLWRRAADLCYKLERFTEAAEYYERIPELLKAADAYVKGQSYHRAGEVFVKLEDLVKAAKMFLKAGDYLRAGAIFEELKDHTSAVKAYRRFLLERSEDSALLSLNDAKRIASIFEKAGEPGKAAELMVRAGQFERAFHLALVSDNMPLAKDIYLKRLHGQGYHLLSLVHNDREVVTRYGDFFIEAGEAEIASMAYEKSENWPKAAMAYEKAGNIEASAELYFKIGEYEKAAVLYEKARHYGTAADTYYKLKNFAKAGENYEKDGDYYKAGRLYQFLGDHEKAVSLLQRIPTEASEYMKATGIIAQAFIKIGLLDLARKRMDEVIASYDLHHENITFFYEIAAALHEMGDLERAKNLLEKIISIDFSMEDARNLLVTVQKELDSRSTAAPTLPHPVPDVPVSRQPSEAPHPGKQSSVRPAPAPSKPKEPVSPRMTKGMQVLKKLSFFKFLRDEDIPNLWETIERDQVEGGIELVTSGNFTESFYVLAKGSLEIRSAMGMTLGKINVMGSAAGLIAALCGEASAVTIVTAEPCALLRVDRNGFLSYLQGIHRSQGATITDHLTASMQSELGFFEKTSVYHQQFNQAVTNLKQVLSS
ncbi:MAG TPA: tetratricopeptide repeat protein [Thermoanaerobaculia bacterium]|nr:tetratricopeptide repeat protein [Thermoanaerobaculia bacterium]HUM29923.1 tetratricopeptide repeat protein [Thermoanaerobaculia bacterium]HXK68210.1 tetratricopeptide repeat protein [Thermoanaerobaculia bacterium]